MIAALVPNIVFMTSSLDCSNQGWGQVQYLYLVLVSMTLFCTHGRVSGPNSLLGHEVIAPCGCSVPCQF